MKSCRRSAVKRVAHYLIVVLGAPVLTALLFLVLPLIQAISKSPTADTVLQTVDTGNLPPPPPPPIEEEPEEEPEEEEPPPELTEDVQPLDLSQLELALNPGGGTGWATGDFGVKLNKVGGGGDDADTLFSLADLDQKPRAIYQPNPVMTAGTRKKAPGKVWIIFVVNADGRVEKPRVQSSTDPVFERPALGAVKKWKFDPGKRNGKAVRFRMRVPLTFPKG